MAARSLASGAGKAWTVIMVVGLLVNTGLLVVSHVGLNAIVYTSVGVDLESPSDDGDLGDGGDVTTGECTGEQDIAIWRGTALFNSTGRCNIWDVMPAISGGNDPRECPYRGADDAKTAYNDFMFAYGMCANGGFSGSTRCAAAESGEAIFNELLQQEWGFTEGCRSCMFKQYECTINKCALTCISNLSNKGCPQRGDSKCPACVQDKCSPAFRTCSGLDTLAYGEYKYNNCPWDGVSELNRLLQDAPPVITECINVLETPEVELTPALDVRFANAVSKAWEGGAKFLAVLVLVASGVWPYLKNVIMAVVWFAPLGAPRRDSALNWLARLGRWSLVDVFAVILIIVGLRLDKLIGGTSYLVVRSESQYAIYCFAVAAVWALAQGEVMRHLSRKQALQNGELPAGAHRKPLGASARRVLLVAFGLCAVAALGLALAGLVLTNMTFTLDFQADGELTGPDKYSYSGFSLGTALVDQCQLGNPGEYFLVFVYFVTVVLLPTLALLGFALLALLPAALVSTYPSLVQAINVCANFSCLDVFLLSMLVLVVQFEPLIEGSIGDAAADYCGGEPGCLKFVGALDTGAYLVAASVPCFWAAQFMSIMVQDHWCDWDARRVSMSSSPADGKADAVLEAQ